MPLLPYLLAGLDGLPGGHSTAIFFSGLLSGLTPVLVYWLAKRLFGELSGRAAGILAGFYGPFVLYSCAMVPASLASLLNAAFLLCVVVAMEKRTKPILLSAGVLLGLATLARAQNLAFVPVCLGLVVILLKSERIRSLVLLGVGFGFVLLPVAIRNVVVTGDLTLVASNGGVNFYIGNGDGANGIWRAPAGVRRTRVEMMEDARSIANEAAGNVLSPEEVSSYWLRRALVEMKADPSRSFRILLRKAWLSVAAFEVPNVIDGQVYREFSPVLWLSFLSWGLLFPLALLGCFQGLRSGGKEQLFPLLFLVCGMLLLVAFFVNARFRVPLAPALLVFAGRGVEWMIQLARTREWKPFSGVVGVMIGLLFLLHRSPFQEEEAAKLRSNSYQLAAQSFRSAGEFPSVRVNLMKALDLEPDSTEILFGLGRVGEQIAESVGLGDPKKKEFLDEAFLYYRRVLKAKPDDFKANLNLGVLILREHLKPGVEIRVALLAEARQCLERAVHGDPSNVSGWIGLGMARSAGGDRPGTLEAYERAHELDGKNENLRKRIESLKAQE